MVENKESTPLLYFAAIEITPTKQVTSIKHQSISCQRHDLCQTSLSKPDVTEFLVSRFRTFNR